MIRVMPSIVCTILFMFFCMVLLNTKMSRIMQDPYFTMVVPDLVIFCCKIQASLGFQWPPMACFSHGFPGGSLAILWCHHLGVRRVDIDLIHVYPPVARAQRASPVHAAGFLPWHVAGCMKLSSYVPSHFRPQRTKS